MLNLLTLFACSPQAPQWALAARIDTLDETIGGPKAMARPGDFRLENDRVRFGVLGPRYSLGPSPFGGTIADADLQRADPRWGGGHGNDQLAEMFATVNMNLAAVDEESEMSILADGSDGEAAIIRVDAPAEPFLTLLIALWTLVDQPDFRITTDYILAPGAPALLIRTTASITTAPTEVPEATVLEGTTAGLDVLDLSLISGVAFGDFYLQGGGIDVFSPGIGFDEDRAVADANDAGINTFASPFQFEFIAGVGDGVSYGIAAVGGDLYVPLFTSSQTAAFGVGVPGDFTSAGDTANPSAGRYDRFPNGASYRYDRYLAVGRGDVGSVLDALIEARGTPFGTVRGHVVEEGTGVAIPHASVLVFQAGAPGAWSQWLTDVGEDTQLDGSFGGKLPPGDYELLVHQRGRPPGERVAITVTEGGEIAIGLASPRPGQVTIDIVDESGRPVPSKVTFFGEGGLKSDYGDPYVGGSPSEVMFTETGHMDVVLPPGRYTAVATRGLEYEIDEAELTVTETGVNRMTMQVVRSVDTTGFVSADLHVHGINSFDSGTKLSDRVVTMVAEGVEFFTSTDHDYLTDYAPTVEDLGLERWVRTAVGLETTTLELGHFLGFPMAAHTREDQGGAFDWTGLTPDEILDELEDLGVAAGYQPVRMVAHPRDGILGLFDQFGFDPITGEIDTPTLSLVNEVLRDPTEYTDSYEALEVLNGKRFEFIRSPTQAELDESRQGNLVPSYRLIERSAQEQEDMQAGVYRLGYGHEGQVDDWFTLLNLGKRITAVGNSDTHGKFAIEAGCPRNFVASATDDPAYLDEQAVADAVRDGHVVASYGPFIRFTANGPENIVGSEIEDTDGTVDLRIEVQAPLWMEVDRVELYQNGTLIHEWAGLEDDVYRLVAELPVTIEKDSWFVVIALGDGDLSPLFSPVEMPPVQLQDVVTEALVDVPGLSSFLAPAAPIAREGVVVPFALTNPIRVRLDGEWTAPGQPAWLLPPVDPAE